MNVELNLTFAHAVDPIYCGERGFINFNVCTFPS